MKPSDSYLAKLKFDPRLLRSPIAHYLTNFRFVLLLIIAIFALGIFSYLNLPRRLNPEVKIPLVSVITTLPGAGPEDVESLVTVPVEDSVSGLEAVSTVSSTSSENVSIVSVEFNSGFDPDRAKDSVQGAVDTVNTFPDEAQTPKVTKLDFENQSVWTFLATGGDVASLLSFSDNLKDKLEKLPQIRDVQISGIENQEIQVLVKSGKQREFGIDPFTLSRAVGAATHSLPSGVVNTENSSFSISLDQGIKSVDDLRNLEVSVGGQIFKLGDVAVVMERSKPNQAQTYFATASDSPSRSVSFSVFKSDSSNIDEAAKATRKAVDETVAIYGGKFKVISVIDLSKLIDEQFSNLSTSFLETILLVIVVLFVFLGIRQAIIVAFCIPLSFLVAFTMMRLSGLTINFLSLFSLLLALGLLVDDAIVIVSAVTAYWRVKKFSPNETGLLVIRDFIVPIWSTTITAVWAFLPLLIAAGIIGEFIKSIPIVVSTTLIASTAIAVLITLPLMMTFLSPKFPRRVQILLWILLLVVIEGFVFLVTRNNPLLPLNLIVVFLLCLFSFWLRESLVSDVFRNLSKIVNIKTIKIKAVSVLNSGLFDSQKFARKYQDVIERIVASRSARFRALVMIVVFAIFSYMLVPLGFVINEFFPKTDAENVFINVELAPGTNLQTTQVEAKNLLESLRSSDEVDYVVAESGKSLDTSGFFGFQTNTNSIEYTLVLRDKDARSKTSGQIADDLRTKYKDYARGKFSVVEESGGPPAGADIQIKLSGEDLSVLDNYADKIVNFLSKESGVTNVEKSIKSGTSKIVFVPDRVKLVQAGIGEEVVGATLRTYLSGFTLESDVKFDGKNRDITFRNSSNTQTVESLGALNIPTQQGGSFPLSALGKFELKPNPTQITREDSKRTLSVTAAVTKGNSVTGENKRLEDFSKKLDLPNGYGWKTGGVNEENQKSVNSILQAMVIAFVLIATTMVLQFGSYRQAFIIMMLIPLAISGVFIIFALSATPLSFPTLIGILALFGIVVYQGMMIVDKINRNLRFGMKLRDAISDACASRVEPILFGTITTVVGLVPITISDPLWRGLGGAIIAGMLFSGAIMLLFIPIVYYQIYKEEVR